MKVNVFNQKGEKTGQAELPGRIFGLKLNPDLLHQVVVAQAANRRQVTAHTKDKGEVRGGGRKPWRQKGTGRARHGSIRSPLWKGGGVTFGPTNRRVFKKIVPKKMARKALLMALSAKAKEGLLVLLDVLRAEKAKTKEMAALLQRLPSQGKSSIIALPSVDNNIILSARNIPKTEIMQAKDLNALDLLSFKYLIMPKESIKVIEETFRNEKCKMKNEKLL